MDDLSSARARLAAIILMGAGLLVAMPHMALSADPGSSESASKIDSVLRTSLCSERTPCELGLRRRAGRDDGGDPARRQVIQQIRLADAWDVRHRQYGECIPHEWWLVEVSGLGGRTSPQVVDRRKLVDLCVGDGSADGVTADSVVVQPDRFIQTSAGGSAWKWETRRIVELRPTRLLRTEHHTHWTLGPNQSRRRVDWQHLASRTDWFAPVCTDETASADEAPSIGEWYSFEAIPRISDAPKTALGSCAAVVDSAEDSDAVGTSQDYGTGYVVDGSPAKSDAGETDATFRALFTSENTLLVDLKDDDWQPSEEGRIPGRDSDHLQLVDGRRYHHMDRCVPPARQNTAWRVRRVGLNGSVDGKQAPEPGDAGVVEADAGDASSAPEAVRVETSRHSDPESPAGIERIRFEITFPEPPRAFTLVYHDADDGESVRRIATSRLVEGQPASLGRIQPLDKRRGRCRVREGRLDFVPSETTPTVPTD